MNGIKGRTEDKLDDHKKMHYSNLKFIIKLIFPALIATKCLVSCKSPTNDQDYD
jgi:hypothetical protein